MMEPKKYDTPRDLVHDYLNLLKRDDGLLSHFSFGGNSHAAPSPWGQSFESKSQFQASDFVCVCGICKRVP